MSDIKSSLDKIKNLPKEPVIYHTKGALFEKLGKIDNAIKQYKLAADYGYNKSQYALGNIYYLKKQYSEAEKWYTMAYKNGIKPARIVLAGVAVNSILGGVISFLSTMYSDRIQSAMLWLNGSLATKTWSHVEMLFAYSIIGLIISLFLIRSANILQLGDDAAKNLGLNVNITRLVICSVAVFLAGISTAVVGVISFVGLIVPHIARMIMGSDHKYTIPFSIVLGGIVLLVADTLGRTIGGAIEIPVGVIMSIFGGPFFLYLLRKRGYE